MNSHSAVRLRRDAGLFSCRAVDPDAVFLSTTRNHAHLSLRRHKLLYLERGLSPSTHAALSSAGHTIGGRAIIGNANLTRIDPDTGEVTVGADPRGENLGLVGPGPARLTVGR